ncbi:MFS transporter [Leucobacter rhizosphaerae]|uniref:MFS transporter n=1 Tax=Leucobacter rhizosphaerae TaxID=2932245 RepID=A0ABY4FX10_9MICO|nr:MFS transporter [Leucobacter rhizosphaerae]UOQ60845.1 MFS transporter [Leucobacter rhizosphaerae]
MTGPMSTAGERASFRVAFFVNLAKLTLLAALTPPVAVGIAARATDIASGLEVAGIVAVTMSTGSICAIIGALLVGRIADIGSASAFRRWTLVLAATVVGTLGLVIAVTGVSPGALLVGWGIAQGGYSGAMAVLRALLATALPRHRSRGAVIMILGAYVGLALPLGVLLVAPELVWQTTFVLSLVSCAVPAMFLFFAPQRAGSGAQLGASPISESAVSAPVRRVHPALLLASQLCVSAVAAAYLAAHALELAARSEDGDAVPVQMAVGLLIAAIAGLVCATAALYARPRFVSHARGCILVSSLVLMVSLGLRGFAEAVAVVGVSAFVSGFAIGILNSVLLAAALEAAPPGRDGRFIGAFSASGAAGQFVGPLLGLGVVFAATALVPGLFTDNPYRTLMLVLAAVALVPGVLWIRRGPREP